MDNEHSTMKILNQRQKLYENHESFEVILVDDMEALSYFHEIYKVANSKLSHTLLYISTITIWNSTLISTIFKRLYQLNILNIALIVEQSPNDLVMITYFPFTPTSCYSTNPVVINSYDISQRQWFHTNYFPKKLDNFYGCHLTCATWEEMPYLTFEFNGTTKTISKYEGLEGKLLEYIAEKLNFTTDIYFMSEKEIKGSFDDNGLVLEKIFETSADFAIGGYYYKPDLNETSLYSQTNYYYLSATYMVVNVFNVYSAYDRIAYPFQMKLWHIIGFILALGSLVICVCDCRSNSSSRSWRTRVHRNFIIGSNNTTPHYNLYTLALGANMSSVQLPRYNMARFLLTCWLLCTLVLRGAYQAGMYEMLRENKHHNPPQTIANVLRQNYVVLLKEMNRGLSDILPEMRNVRDLNKGILETFREMVDANEHRAIVTQSEYFGYFGQINATWRRLHLVNERIYTQQLAMYVRHHSYLVHELNAQIARAQRFGFISRWARTYFESPSTGNGKSYQADAVQTNTLSMRELAAIFMILVWLHLIALGVFLIELVWHKYVGYVWKWHNDADKKQSADIVIFSHLNEQV